MNDALRYMMLGQVSFEELRQSLTQQFNEPGSVTGLVLAALTLAAVVILAWLLQRWQERRRVPADMWDAPGLYRELLDRLDLPEDQRGVLTAVARDLRLANPAVILISRRLFDESMEAWGTRHRGSDVLVGRIRQRLFP